MTDGKKENISIIKPYDVPIITNIPDSIISFKIYAFDNEPGCSVTLSASESLENFSELSTKTESFPPYKNAYDFFNPVIYTCEEFPPNTRFIKISFNADVQLCRTEIEYIQ